MSCLMLSSHLYLGLPCDLLVRGFQLNIFLTVPVSGILCMWPNQLSLWALMWLIIFLYFIGLSNSSLVLTLHIWFSFVGPNILFKIFLSKTNNFWIMASFNTHSHVVRIRILFQQCQWLRYFGLLLQCGRHPCSSGVLWGVCWWFIRWPTANQNSASILKERRSKSWLFVCPGLYMT